MNYIAKKLTELEFEYHSKMVKLYHILYKLRLIRIDKTIECVQKHMTKEVDALRRLGIEVGHF